MRAFTGFVFDLQFEMTIMGCGGGRTAEVEPQKGGMRQGVGGRHRRGLLWTCMPEITAMLKREPWVDLSGRREAALPVGWMYTVGKEKLLRGFWVPS